jgi:hypothetical protein
LTEELLKKELTNDEFLFVQKGRYPTVTYLETYAQWEKKQAKAKEKCTIQ